MISARDLDRLFVWKAPSRQSILSLYLDRRGARGLWSLEDLRIAAKGRLKQLESAIEEREIASLTATFEKIVSQLPEAPRSGHSLVAFAQSGEDGVWLRDLKVPVTSQAHWGPTPYLRPLLEAVEEYERYGVVLVDKMRARLFTIFLGEIEEERDAFNPEPVKHVASTGSDQALTMNLQRRADAHAHRHWKRVAALLDAMERERRFDRLILGGSNDAVAQLRHVLPKRLASRLAGTVSLPVESSESEVLRHTLEIERNAQRARQKESVEELETASAKDARAAAGLEPILEAFREGRIRTLLYVDGLTLRGRECPRCGSLFDETAMRCAYCEAETRPLDDLVETMAERVAESGGRIEPVGDPAAERLKELGAIGAFLRF